MTRRPGGKLDASRYHRFRRYTLINGTAFIDWIYVDDGFKVVDVRRRCV
ncbi:MAG: hypothetical protein KF774_05345 [Planctomyces sp.]|nr:hypothetical protein [Planctomyces sp.]